MLTTQSRAVLRELLALTNRSDKAFVMEVDPVERHIVLAYDESNRFFDYAPYEHEIDSILRLLISEGYVCQPHDYSYALTQKALHDKQFVAHVFVDYLIHNWIAILALIISIVSLIFSLKQ